MRGLFLLAVALGQPAMVSAGGIELHAHLFMKEGMSPMFRGDFFGPLKATSWRDRFSSQANPETLNASGLQVAVVSLYSHPVLTLSMRDSVRRQIALARKFVGENPEWILPRTAKEARDGVAHGKRLLVLSLEGAMGIIETEEDLKEFVDNSGIRIVTLLHLTDDLFGGVALLRGILGFASPIALVRSWFSGTRDVDGVLVNGAGLTEKGRWMARELIKRHVWLDLSHASDASQAELVPMLRAAGQPLLYTHTTLRRFLRAERGITAEQLQGVRETKGLLGVMPAEDMLLGTNSEGGLTALSAQAREIGLVIGADGVAMGSDYNGGVQHLHPSVGTGTSLDQEQGLWQIGQSGDVWRGLKLAPDPVVARFLAGWEKVDSTRCP
ncbi:MAG: membrane dipeptidase [Deltaproteobacteria bacterium]|nr:membrane dipeptidase [Deltaproteobacteria bacterium]